MTLGRRWQTEWVTMPGPRAPSDKLVRDRIEVSIRFLHGSTVGEVRGTAPYVQ